MFCVVADNLGAHSISGLVENLSGPYICRFCLGHGSEYERKGVRLAGFPAGTKGKHATHSLTMTENPTLTHSYGVKKACPVTEHLNHFQCVTGYPPDILHDIFEGIVP